MRASAKGHSGVVLESQLGASGPLGIVVSPVAVTLATSATMMSQACQLRAAGKDRPARATSLTGSSTGIVAGGQQVEALHS